MWQNSAPGIWQQTIDAPKSGIAIAEPKTDALSEMPAVEFPLAEENIHIDILDQGTVIRLPLQPNEQLFGFGLQFQKINQRNSVLHLHMDHYGGKDNGRTHAPIPFYVSSAGYGVWINTAHYVSIYAGSANRKDSPNPPEAKDRTTDRSWTAQPISDAVEIFVPSRAVEIVIFGGPTPLQAVQRYNLYCGGGCLPPRWGLGFWHRVPTPYTDEQVEAEIDAFAEHDFPLHVIGLEPGWHSKAYPCTYEWSPDRFPNPKSFIECLTAKNIHVNLWENPYVSPDASIYEKMEPLSGSHTVWCGLVPDYTLPEAQNILATQHEDAHFKIGVSGYKIDECDGYDRWLWPDHATFPSGKSGIELRQTYGLHLQNLTTNIFRKNNTRTFGLVRGTHSGSQPLPYVLYSDYYNHRDYITALCNSGISGLLWCPEVRSASSPQDWIRRVQTACFSPLAQLNAWASSTKPWSFPEVEDAVRKAIQLRLRLTPYIYSAFARYHKDGTPPFRPMALEHPVVQAETSDQGTLDDADNPYALPEIAEIKDQYMMGDSLMVAPLFDDETQRDVIFPPGNWYDFYTGQCAGNNETLAINAELDTIPLYVKDGGIIPLLPKETELHENPADHTLEIRHYGQSDGHFLLYNDDGETYDYETGNYTWQTLSVTNSEPQGHTTLHSGSEAWYCKNLNWKFMTK